MYLCDGLTSLCVLVAWTAVVVTGIPHRCSGYHDDYANAILARYYNSGPVPVAIEPVAVEPAATAVEYEPVAPSRPGRSNDHEKTASEDPEVKRPVTAVVDQQQPSVNGTDTSAALAVNKLAEYYEQLRVQQELLARQQAQQQMYEVQQRRKQDYLMFQQMMQQQYYKQQQQQQHQALLLFDQLRKNPAFVGQVSAFVNQVLNGTTKPVVPEAPGTPSVVGAPAIVGVSADVGAPTPADAVTAVDCKKTLPDDKMNGEIDGPAVDVVERDSAKHLEARRAVEDSAEDRPASDDEQNLPVLEKIYTVPSER